MERVQCGKVETATPPMQEEKPQPKYKILKRKHKALQQKYNDLEKETMRRQIAHDIHIEILTKERSVREYLFNHAISELESKLATTTAEV